MPLIPDINERPKQNSQPHRIQTSSIKAVDTPAQVIGPNKGGAHRPRRPWKHKRLWQVLGIVFAFLLVIGIYCGIQMKRLYNAGLAAKADFESVQDNVEATHYKEAKVALASGTSHIKEAHQASKGLWPIKWLPYIHTQFVVLDQLLIAGEHMGAAGEPLLTILQDVNGLVDNDQVTVSKIGKAEREALLQTLSESPETLTAAQADLQAAVAALKDLPDHGVAAPLQVIVGAIQTNLPNIEAAVEKGLPFLTVAPTIAGYPDSKTYLFLLQNNTELRPTGGFIGTYGILELESGDIAEFKTDNIYNIDNKVKNTWPEQKPAPMLKYLNDAPFYLRDVNWDPDFPTTARKAEDFYLRESGSNRTIDGVIAMTPEVIHDLLGVTGPITIEGDEYTFENFTEKLQYEVEIAYYQEGISDAARKDVIDKLANQLMERVMNLPRSQWGSLMDMMLTNLEEKHILIYSDDEDVQQLVGDTGWDGSLRDTDTDFLMVVDANLAAKKTDRAMTKNLDYTITKEGDDYIANLTLKYKNDGVFDDFTTRYRSYTRIYVPEGSELLDSSGFLTNDRYLGGDETGATTEDGVQHGKTVFAGFLSVEPQSTDTMKLRYKLPEKVADQIEAGTYELYWQKQPGTANVYADLALDMGKKVDSATSLDEAAEIDNTKVHFTTQLLRDLQLVVDFK